MSYATREDLYNYGLPRGLLANPGRLVAAVYPASDVIELDQHGFDDGTPLVFRAEDGGSLPAEIVAGTTYYAKRLTDATLQIAATNGGSAIDLTTAGASVVVSTTLPIDEAIAWASDLVNENLPAHVVPLTEPYPVTVVAIVSDLAVQRLLTYTGQASVSLAQAQAFALKQLERWASGIPIRGTVNPDRANLAVVGNASDDASTSSPWCSTGGCLP